MLTAQQKLKDAFLFFKKEYAKCEGFNDDRHLFRVLYETHVQTINDLIAIESIATENIKYAVNKEIYRQYKELQDLKNSLKERNMI